jgi:chorismate mutase
VFQTAFQSAPLDFNTDAFFPARAAAIEARLNDVAVGGAGELAIGNICYTCIAVVSLL